MRVAILSDIGQPTYHVGHEAVCQAAVDALKARGITDLVLLTHNVAQTLEQHHDVEAIAALSLLGPPDQRQQRLHEIDQVLAGDAEAFAESDPILALMESLRGVDAVLVVGGDQMNSQFGRFLYERAAVVRVAQHLNKPVVFSGQTLNPDMSPADREVLRETLEKATLVGLRDPESYRLANDLCPHHRGVRQSADDVTGWALDALSSQWSQHAADTRCTQPARW